MTRRALTDGRSRFLVALFFFTLTLSGLGLVNTDAALAADNAHAFSPTVTYQSADGDQGGG